MMTRDVERQMEATEYAPRTVRYIAGPPRSGRTTALMRIAALWATRKLRVVAVTGADFADAVAKLQSFDAEAWKHVSLLAGSADFLETRLARRASGLRADAVIVDTASVSPAALASLLAVFGPDACYVVGVPTARPASERGAESAVPPNA